MYYLSYSDSYVFCVFWNSSLTVASPIWPILQSMSLPAKASQNNFHTRGFSPKYIFFFFKCEDGWIIASEIKTECYNPGNFQNIKLLLMAMSSSTCCPCCLLPSLLPSGCQIQYLFYHPSSWTPILSLPDQPLYQEYYFPDVLSTSLRCVRLLTFFFPNYALF